MGVNATSGPWYAVLNSAGSWDVNVGSSQYSQSVASVITNKYIDGDARSNADLIAAAPDMYSALQNIAVNGSVSQIISKADRDAMDYALKKARGDYER